MSRRTYLPLVLTVLFAATASAQPPIPPASEPVPQFAEPTLLRIDAAFPLELLPIAATYHLGTVAAEQWYDMPGTQVGAALATARPCPAPVAIPTPPPVPVVTVAALSQTVAGSAQTDATPSTCPRILPVAGCAGAPVACCSAKPVIGTATWYRQMPGAVTAFTIQGDSLKMTLTYTEGGCTVKLTLQANCAVTNDGTVHGVITGVDVNLSGNNALTGMEFADLALRLQDLVDQPFAFRCRSSENGLMVGNVRFGKDHTAGADFVVMLSGQYKAAGCCGVPNPVPVATVKFEARTAAAPCPQSVPLIAVCEPCPPVVCPPPLPIAGPPVVCPTYGLPVGVGGPPLPVGMGPMPVGFMVPPPPIPMAMPLPGALHGTWIRKLGPTQCEYSFQNGQLMLTVKVTEEAKGKCCTLGFVVTADTYPTRDGQGIVGIITGLDVICDCSEVTAHDLDNSLREFGKLQKSLVGQPFSLSYRIQGDVLMIGNLRIAHDKSESFDELLHLVTGRFQPANVKGAPVVKAITVNVCEPACRVKSGDVSVVEFKTMPELPVMLPPTPLPQTGPVIPTGGVQFERYEPCSPEPILDGVREGVGQYLKSS